MYKILLILVETLQINTKTSDICEEAELSLGFAIVGYAPVETLMTKGGMKQVLFTSY